MVNISKVKTCPVCGLESSESLRPLRRKAITEVCGVRQLRVRDHGGLARIEINRDDFHRVFSAEAIEKIT